MHGNMQEGSMTIFKQGGSGGEDMKMFFSCWCRQRYCTFFLRASKNLGSAADSLIRTNWEFQILTDLSSSDSQLCCPFFQLRLSSMSLEGECSINYTYGPWFYAYWHHLRPQCVPEPVLEHNHKVFLQPVLQYKRTKFLTRCSNEGELIRCR